MIFFSNNKRPFEFGPYPLERLKRDNAVIDIESQKPKIQRRSPQGAEIRKVLSNTLSKYHEFYRGSGSLEKLPPRAPVPDDLHRRSIDIKGAGYFLDIAHVGICKMVSNVSTCSYF